MTDIDTADHVRHEPSGEHWLVCFVDEERNQLCPGGWPLTIARLSDCTLIRKASDAERLKLLADMRRLPASDPRGRYARDINNGNV